jgi:hypothetical protein
MGNLAYLFGETPTAQISAKPRVGYYYQTKKGDTPWAVANEAYKKQGLTDVKTGLFLMNDNAANDHIKKGSSGWESYKIKGLQFDPKYAVSPTAEYGTGKSYPIVWIPPLDGTGPGGGIADPVPGIPGPPGPTGPMGPPGPAPSNALIKKLIGDYMIENPTGGGLTDKQIDQRIAVYMQKHPVAKGERGERGQQGIPGQPGATPSNALIKKLIGDYMIENPLTGDGVTPQELDQAIAAYMQKHPIAKGERGERGPQGIPGKDGSDAQFDMNQARDFVDARIRVALRDFKPETGETAPPVQLAGFDWQKLVAAGVFGGAIVVALNVWKRRKR